MAGQQDVLDYWLNELGEAGWYAGGAALDDAIRARFAPLWAEARQGRLDNWQITPGGSLAYLILTDQMPRNMFRDQAAAFATDSLAHAAANRAILLGWDTLVPVPQRQFFYLPMMHAENQFDQNRSVAFFATRMPGDAADHALHARAHRQVIRAFGRFPTRNAALGRESSAAERAYLAAGGYRATLQALQV